MKNTNLSDQTPIFTTADMKAAFIAGAQFEQYLSDEYGMDEDDYEGQNTEDFDTWLCEMYEMNWVD